MKLSEVAVKNVEFTEDELIDIALLVHDKAHVMPTYNHRDPSLEKAIKHFSEKSPSLWRGVYPPELKRLVVGETFPISAYMSMSENERIARAFGKNTKTLIHVKGINAFPYWSWNIEHLQMTSKAQDPEAWVNNDGDHSVSTLKKEAEWIVGHDVKLKVVSSREDDGYTIFELETE